MYNDRKALEITVDQARVVSALDQHEGWHLLKEWLEEGRSIHDRDLKSFKYVNDHTGYLTTLARYNAYNDVLRFVEDTIAAGVEASKELEADAE